MNIEILPANIKTITIRVRKRGKYTTAQMAIPQEILERYDFKDGEKLVFCYVCRAEDDIKSQK